MIYNTIYRCDTAFFNPRSPTPLNSHVTLSTYSRPRNLLLLRLKDKLPKVQRPRKIGPRNLRIIAQNPRNRTATQRRIRPKLPPKPHHQRSRSRYPPSHSILSNAHVHCRNHRFTGLHSGHADHSPHYPERHTLDIHARHRRASLAEVIAGEDARHDLRVDGLDLWDEVSQNRCHDGLADGQTAGVFGGCEDGDGELGARVEGDHGVVAPYVAALRDQRGGLVVARGKLQKLPWQSVA